MFIDPINDEQIELDLAALVTLIKGSSITSMAHADQFFELGLSDALNLRIQADNGEIDILLFSTLNKGDLPPVRLQVIAGDEVPTAEAFEKRIHALRQLYATAFLIDAGRADEIAQALDQNPDTDLEASLLEENDRLFIRAASTGSFWITVLTKTKTAFSTLSLIGPLFYDEGRQALLSRLRATTELKWLEVKQKSDDITLQGANRLIDMIQKVEKIKNQALRDQMHALLIDKVRDMGRSDLSSLALPRPRPQQRPTGTAITSVKSLRAPNPTDEQK
jgi:hypothetical protein